MSRALEHCGYEVLDDGPGGEYVFKLTTPFEGASVEAALLPSGTPDREFGSGRDWVFKLLVRNRRGTGWTIDGQFSDMGRSVAKALLRSMALELRRRYNHRSPRSGRRALAMAMAAKKGGAE